MLAFSCENYIDKPENLLSENKMAEIMADMALNDYSTYLNPTSNVEIGTRFILKKHNVKADNFMSSYKYYVVKKEMSAITVKSQNILKEKNPEAENFINKKMKENTPLPTTTE
ncbi:menaquinone-dependent protoporphyrinogen IX oxidase [Chryseobacterium sp. 16F]|uniref:Menaquinone-dependent protoporphyrinogen IX oxidase n=2 Tax=Frigoriflavimonas asaccharolytica TaxID=2735899 RepID=A0A8J8G4G1_9FLAO|nr:menaquinone-dependent protoporphyrinogen IX oxidase [Frigoriflavimonas asaccharolytica]